MSTPPFPLPADLLRARIEVEEEEANIRLDFLLQRRLRLPRPKFYRLLGEGRIRLNGRAEVTGSPRVPAGTIIEILSDTADPRFMAEQIPLPVLYEDAHFFVVEKPGDMVMTPGEGHPAGTLANGLRGLGRPLSDAEGPFRPGIVHRLDVGTSGLVLVAKDNTTHYHLTALFLRRAIHKEYLAIVVGVPSWQEKIVDEPLGKKRRGRKARGVIAHGKTANTRFVVEKCGPHHALLRAFPYTGRTHQIRVHLARLELPILGDTLYGGGSPAARSAARLGLRRPALHAYRLQSDELGLDVCSPLPADMRHTCERIFLSCEL